MSLLDTYVKLQAINQQRQAQQAQELHSILYLVNAVKQMRDMDLENRSTIAAGGVPRDITTQSFGGITNLPEGYDVANPDEVVTHSIPKLPSQYYGDVADAVGKVSSKYQLPFIEKSITAKKEEDKDRWEREKNPIIQTTYNGQTISGALSNIGPLEERRQTRESNELYRSDRLEETKRHNEVMEGIRKAIGEKDKNKLTISDVKGAYGMEMSGIKNRIALDLIKSPAESQALAGQPAENLMALLMSGSIKSMPQEKIQGYMDEIKQVEDYYGKLSSSVLGRKGATPKAPKTATPTQPQGKVINTLPTGSKMIGTKDGKEVWQDPKTGIRYLKD